MSNISVFVLLPLVATAILTLLAGVTNALPLSSPDMMLADAAPSTEDYQMNGNSSDRYVKVDLVSRKAQHTPLKAAYGKCYKQAKSVWDDTSYLSVKTKNMVCSIYSDSKCSKDKSLVSGSVHVDVPRVTPGPVAFKCWPSPTPIVDA
ncbi:hypothetical protein BGW41_005765 [Actinomortierella wolfii]|nr:hypothetical protein BGW41_005765 [Actinomortierella wolfii]